ncbi:MAG: PAS domain S-box protein [Desulfobacula sp.]|jgi:PAS domain S-box-containing protein|uniref:sensor histidine kinase n=3 Tax=Desulfobacula sp. TaxID=2593537 RepID=UPI001D795D46|nr:PAS domain S-box protein [Desulfobacula sp.]MBT3803082.1 PAS domain S-box protein [Desulfobacula sp.]MBT4197130.1 PAS domain S-box protein [Desulfobacula sp.]MBT4507337.1 PAS domain S-box protein [Desulfobacula sp.]MBT5543057.1 PAS domain S-box protein [Desulfobacula sp.]
MKIADKKSTLQDVQSDEKLAFTRLKKENLDQNRVHSLLKFLPDPVLAFSLDNKVEYINPEFEKVFGWTLKEVKGKNIKFIPDNAINQTKERMKQLLKNRSSYNFETQRYTKDGRILDILINGSILYNQNNKATGLVLVFRDLTTEKRMTKSNQIMFKISKALHHYQKLGDLITFINKEIQKLISVEGSFIMLADKPKKQLYFLSAQYRDSESEKQFEKIRFPDNQGVSGRVYKSGKPLIIPDVSKCSFFLKRITNETDLNTNNMLSVPLKLKDKTIGVVTVANKLHGEFDNIDTELLSMVSNTIALPIENARIHEELQKSNKELKALNHAKDKVVNHLAHELKTPISVLGASIKLLLKKYRTEGLENPLIKKILERGLRNLNRILEVQNEVEDLLRIKDFKAYKILNKLVDACKDELAILFENETENTDILDRVNETIESVFGPQKMYAQKVFLVDYIPKLLKKLRLGFMHRKCLLNTQMEKTLPVYIPPEILEKITTGIIRNAFEYTPDNSKIDIIVKQTANGPELIITDYGIGFSKEKLHLIFENYFAPPESIDYSTKNAYDFNAGGSGFDLLRIKIFSEFYNFKIEINSERCSLIPNDNDLCPGDIDLCQACAGQNGCFNSGGTSIHIQFLQ